MKTNKSVLYIDLATREYSFKTIEGISTYIGGEVLGNFLLKSFIENTGIKQESNYFSLVSGPLNGVFPYTSKAVANFFSGGYKSSFVGGGKVGGFLNFSNLYAIEVVNSSEKPVYLEIKKGEVKFVNTNSNIRSLGLSGRRFIVEFEKDVFVDGVFSYGSNTLKNNLKGLVFSYDGEYSIKDLDDYNDVLEKIRSREKELLVSRSNNYSCLGCPMGCDFSTSVDNSKTSALTKSLVGCSFADSIYSDINLVFLCFQSIGFSYNHEFLEQFPYSAGLLNKSLNELLESYKV